VGASQNRLGDRVHDEQGHASRGNEDFSLAKCDDMGIFRSKVKLHILALSGQRSAVSKRRRLFVWLKADG
jgi:hypothetical protein